MTDSTEQKFASAERLPQVGEVVAGKYRIERHIAEGGMGLVVEAHHLELDEKVAIKFMRPDILDQALDRRAELIERFLREGRAVIKIRSEHVVRVLDVSKMESGVPFMVMEYLEGTDLDQRVFHGPLPIQEAVDYVLQSLEALAEAHALGMVHRDLKPANILIVKRRDGTDSAKVLDFGISKVVQTGDDFKATRADAIMGSPKYMSPEQMRSTRDVDARADIWAIGTILYELTSGQTPFDGATMTELCASILQDAPRAIARNDLPPELQRVIFRCLEKSPEARFANVAELAYALVPFGSEATKGSAQRAARVLRVEAVATVSSPTLDASSTKASQGALAHTVTAWEPDPPRKKPKTTLVVSVIAGAAALIVVAAAMSKSKSVPIAHEDSVPASARAGSTGLTPSNSAEAPPVPLPTVTPTTAATASGSSSAAVPSEKPALKPPLKTHSLATARTAEPKKPNGSVDWGSRK